MRIEFHYLNPTTNDYFVSIGAEVEREGYISVPARPGPGYLYDEENGWLENPAYVEPAVFPELTARQLRLMLLNISITPALVDAEIATIEDASDRAAAQIEWEHASTYRRDHPLVDQMAAAFELPTLQVDTLWLAAADL